MQNDFVNRFFKDQRLQLELKTLTLSDLWDYIPGRDDSNKIISLSILTNIWEALESVLQSGNKYVRIENQKGNSKSLSYKELMTAYSEFKIAINE